MPPRAGTAGVHVAATRNHLRRRGRRRSPRPPTGQRLPRHRTVAGGTPKQWPRLPITDSRLRSPTDHLKTARYRASVSSRHNRQVRDHRAARQTMTHRHQDHPCRGRIRTRPVVDPMAAPRRNPRRRRIGSRGLVSGPALHALVFSPHRPSPTNQPAPRASGTPDTLRAVPDPATTRDAGGLHNKLHFVTSNRSTQDRIRERCGVSEQFRQFVFAGDPRPPFRPLA